MNRAAVIEQLKQTQEMLTKLLALLEAGEADKFAAHLYQARREYRSARASEATSSADRALGPRSGYPGGLHHEPG
jgi:hypothetical protein